MWSHGTIRNERFPLALRTTFRHWLFKTWDVCDIFFSSFAIHSIIHSFSNRSEHDRERCITMSAFEAECIELCLCNDRGAYVHWVLFAWLCTCAQKDIRERWWTLANGRTQPNVCLKTAGELRNILTFLKGGENDKISWQVKTYGNQKKILLERGHAPSSARCRELPITRCEDQKKVSCDSHMFSREQSCPQVKQHQPHPFPGRQVTLLSCLGVEWR